MSMRDKLAAKSAAIDLEKVGQHAEKSGAREPRTAPGSLLRAIPQLAEKDEQIAELKRRVEEAEANAQSRELSLDLMDEVEGRRRLLSEKEYTDLKNNLSKNKLTHAITVRLKSDGRYEIISGHNRVAIYRELGRTHIPTIVLSYADDAEAESSALYANLFQSELPDYFKYLGIKKLMLMHNKNQSEIAVDGGLDKAMVSRWMSFEHMPEEALAAIRLKPFDIGSGTIQSLATLIKEGKGGKVVEVVKAILDKKITAEAGIERAAKSDTPATSSSQQREPVLIKAGRLNFCKMRFKANFVTLEFRAGDSDKQKMIEEEIREVLERHANNEVSE